MSEDIAIRVENLTKIYKLYDSPVDRLKESLHPFRRKYHKDFYALNNVSFVIKKGETAGIIGKNGSGKSTLLKILSGVLTPSSGTVKVDGKVSALLELGAGFNPDLTGIENVYFNGTLMGYSREEMNERLDDILAFADIGEFLYQPVKVYSSGMFVKLAFSVAINVEPEILIVDEALAVGDIRFQQKCFSKINEFKQKQKTILFVSHAMETINMICSSAILIDNGILIHSGLPKNITKAYYKMIMVCEDNSYPKYIEDEYDYSNKQLIDNQKIDLANIQSENQNSKVKQANKKATIIDYNIVDASGRSTTVLETGKKYKLICKVIVVKPVKALHVGFPIRNPKGLLIFATNTAILGTDIGPQPEGTVIEVSLDVTMWLAPGDYFLTYLAGTHDEQYDEVSDAIHFVVTGTNKINLASIVNLDPVVSIDVINSRHHTNGEV